ncbi:MAG: UDP-N-acetylmuramoyl-tripeptide--D-alanyl-D-alanine ligase [Woeseia sp.]
MMDGTLLQAAEVVRGTLHGADLPFRGVSTDTRTLNAGELFFALRGPNYDGEEFIPRAGANGAVGAVAQDLVDGQLPVIEVKDVRRALGALAAEWRRRVPATIIGLTGSNGKTTLKELIAACLSQAGPTLATRGNLNNDVGLPLMLCEMGQQHRFAVIEMGANHVGEIAYLTSLAMPHIAVITNAGPAHLEGFGSIEAVASAKGEILQGASSPEWAILNADDKYYPLWKKLARRSQVASFGLASDADFRAVDVNVSASGSTFTLLAADRRTGSPRSGELRIRLPLPGRHNVAHACAAAAVASVLGMEGELIERALASVQPVAGRLRPLRGIAGATLYDDSYNANPASVVAAAEYLAACNGKGWLVLGDMRELGDDAAELHRSVGEAARKAGVTRLFATGPLARNAVDAFGPRAEWFETVEELVGELRRTVSQDVNVLVKGSRSMHMERVVQALRPAVEGGS